MSIHIPLPGFVMLDRAIIGAKEQLELVAKPETRRTLGGRSSS